MPACARSPSHQPVRRQQHLPETRLRVSAIPSWPRHRASIADVEDSIRENSHRYDGLASGSIYFLSRDPAAAATRSPYGYVGGNPLNATDPTGLDNCGPFAWFCDAVATGAQGVANQVVSWAGDINNFGNNNVFGVCASGSAGAGPFAVVGSGCLAFNFHTFGVTGTIGQGWEFPGGASVGVGPMFTSGASSLQDLKGHFSYTGASAGEWAPVVGIDSASGFGTCGQPVNEHNLSVGGGLNLPWPGSAHQGDSDTWVWSP